MISSILMVKMTKIEGTVSGLPPMFRGLSGHKGGEFLSFKPITVGEANKVGPIPHICAITEGIYDRHLVRFTVPGFQVLVKTYPSRIDRDWETPRPYGR